MADTQRPRRWGVTLGITALVLWVLALVGGIIALVATAPAATDVTRRWAEEEIQGEGVDRVALIEVVGEIVPGRSEGGGLFGSGPLGADDYISQLRQALEDDGVKAVVLRLDTPGGAVVASDEIYRMVRAVDARKPVIASMGDVAASGGYYLAAGTSQIWANPATVTGSIGVIAIFPNLEGTAEKIGLRPIVIKSGKLKDLGSPFRDMTAEERTIIQNLIDGAYDRFVDAVATGRSLTRAVVLRLADGRVYSGEQAKANGLVDELGDLDDAFESAKRKAAIDEARLVRYVAPGFGLAEAFFGFRGIGRDLGDVVREAGSEAVGLPARPGLHYLWLR